jgi:hypothetical protein
MPSFYGMFYGFFTAIEGCLAKVKRALDYFRRDALPFQFLLSGNVLFTQAC